MIEYNPTAVERMIQGRHLSVNVDTKNGFWPFEMLVLLVADSFSMGNSSDASKPWTGQELLAWYPHFVILEINLTVRSASAQAACHGY